MCNFQSAVLPNAQCLANIPTVNLTNVTNKLWDASDECISTFGNNPLFCSVYYIYIYRFEIYYVHFIIELSFKYPGQIWSADDQCKMRNGNGSYFCSVIKNE